MQILALLLGLLDKGILFTFLIIGIYIASKIISFDNMSIEGGFSLGGAIAAITLNCYWNPFLSIFIAALCAGLTGLITGFLYEKCGINHIISGIIVTTGLFSIVLKLASSNLCIPQDMPTVFTYWKSFCHYDLSSIFLLVMLIGMIALVKMFLRTKIGLMLYAVGCNRQFLMTLGRWPGWYLFLGLFLSNFFAGLSHALFVHYLGYFSIWFSNGVIITALAGMILADLVVLSFDYGLIIGGILYQAILMITIHLHIHPDWNNLIKAILIIAVLLMHDKKNINQGQRA